jgi:C4-dicarboxylate transporter DctQ subunit
MNFWRTHLRNVAEFFTATMLAVMFFTFVVQIIARYFFTPIGWTVELISVLWIWVIFIGNAFVVRGRDHVTFDILYLWAPNKVRRFMAILSATVVGGIFLWSFLPTWDYFQFLNIKTTPLLKIPFNWFFSCFIIFLVAAIIYSLLKIREAIRDELPVSPNEIHLAAMTEGEDK